MAGEVTPQGKRGRGRPRGSLNKRSVEVAEKLEALSCDPFEGMALLAMQQCPCPTCQGSGRAKYVRYPDVGYVWEPQQGIERECLTCTGTGHEPITPELRGKMYSELAQYVAPKRKAVEHSGDVDNPLQYKIHVDVSKLTDAQLEALEALGEAEG